MAIVALILFSEGTLIRMVRGRSDASPTGEAPAQKRSAPRPGQLPPQPHFGPRSQRHDDGDAGDYSEPARPAGKVGWDERKRRVAQAFQARLPEDKAAYRAAFPRVQRLNSRKLKAVTDLVQAEVHEVFGAHPCTVDAGPSASSSAAGGATFRTATYVTHLGGALLRIPTCTGCNATVQPYDVGCASWTPIVQTGWVDQELLEDANYSLVINGQSISGKEGTTGGGI